jgi:multidrug efflux pump subunit AcrA (membrane-fusion protein)
VFEKDLSAARQLQGQRVSFVASSYPGREFSAEVFSPGSMVHDQTRAASLLALVDNAEGLLKPGMFVAIELRPPDDRRVLQTPAAAVQRHGDKTFVFLPLGAGRFEARTVALGRSTSEQVEVSDGLAEGELVVVKGAFALKSQLLGELMTE